MCGASGIRSLKGGLCHGPAGVPRLATRCLCLLSTWLVVCLVPCAPMSIVCPLPSCYVIIVSVAPAVSPSLPSFVSLYSSPCVCSPVLIRCLSCVFVMWVSCWLCSSLLPACLFFPFGVVFVLCFILLLKKPDISAFESSTSSLVTLGWCKNEYTPQQKLLNLVLCMASMIFNDSTKSSRHGMNKSATFCQIYLFPFFKNDLF